MNVLSKVCFAYIVQSKKFLYMVMVMLYSRESLIDVQNSQTIDRVHIEFAVQHESVHIYGS